MPTREENKKFWGEVYDWADAGEDWTPDEKWRTTILENSLGKFLKPGAVVVEIGPGAGRWTQELLARKPERLLLIDIADKCLDLCRERFKNHNNIDYYLNNGRSLGVVPSHSVDMVWSWDVFVHVEADDVAAYFAEFRRILKPGGVGIIHYASIDRARCPDPRSGWRADFTSGQMFEVVETNKLLILQDIYDPDISHTNSSVVIFQQPEADTADRELA